MGRVVSDGFEPDAGGPTRWRARNLRAFRPTGALVDRARGLRADVDNYSLRLVVVQESGYVSLCCAAGRDAARPSSTTGTNGTAGPCPNDHRRHHTNRVCALLPAVSDNDRLDH